MKLRYWIWKQKIGDLKVCSGVHQLTECVRMSTTPAFLSCRELDICVGMLKEARMLVEGVPGAALVARFDIRADSIREPIEPIEKK